MTDRRSSWAATLGIVALLVVTVLAAHVGVAVAVPAHEEPFVLEQPDGTQFVARQFGDEWMNGTETVDGYTIVKHAASGYWTYADVAQSGRLVSSPYVVGRDLPYALPQGVRPAVNPNKPADGAQSFSIDAPNAAFLGTKRMLVILVDFADEPSTTTAAAWQSRFFGASNSVKDFYKTTSYNALTIAPAAEDNGTANDGIVGWLRMAGSHPNFAGAIGATARTLAANAMTAASANINYAAFDTNGDGFLSESELLIIVIVAGSETSFAGGCAPSVWGHRWGLAAPITLDGKQLQSYAMFGEKHCNPASPGTAAQASLGIIVHETGHLLGLPDLYDIDNSSEGVGRWSVMGSGSWNQKPVAGSRAGDSPSFMDPWSKFNLGWITPTLVAGTLTGQAIQDATTSSTVFRFRSGTEYFLLENRNQTDYDEGLPGRGLLIWHIDELKTSNQEECSFGGILLLAPCSATLHPKVRVVQADNDYDLELKANRGDAGDPFPGTANRRSFTNTSTPSSKRYSGASSSMNVTAISDPGATMTATLSATAPAGITVVSPNGGQEYAIGIVRNITWTSTGVTGNVKIQLSRNGGTSWSNIVANTANDNTHAWTVTGPDTALALVKICSVDTPSVCDTSNNTFAIGRTVRLIAPNGGESWPVGASKTIQWATSGITGNVKLQISRNGGTSWSNLIASTADDGTHAWTVLAPTSTTARLRVCSIELPVICDESDANFTIASSGTVNLVATGIGFPTAVTRGGAWSVRLVSQNTGTGTAPATQTKVYVSTDQLFSESADFFVVTLNIPALGPGAVNDQTKSVAVFPSTMAAGTYYVVVRLDANDAVVETNENNVYYATTLLTVN